MSAVERGRCGVTPRAPRLEEESYLGFMESVRNLAIRRMFPEVVLGETLAVDAELRAKSGGEPPLREFVRAADDRPGVATWKRVMRTQQQRTWAKLFEAYGAERARYEAELDAAEKAAPDRLAYDPAFRVPRYATLDIHLQPGGYTEDPLAGYVFHHGTRVFYQGDNDQDELHRQVAGFVAPPADGRVARVLDVGCSIGQCTTALKQRFPQAEVTGLDVGLPMVRYAHRRALDLGIDVKFRQGLAEATGYPDGHFDAVLAYILFHEVPSRLFRPIIAEMFRVLRPGGTFTVVDAPNQQGFPPPNRLWLQFDAQYNCEPYSPAFVASDLQQLLRDAGFRVTASGPTPGFLAFTTAEKPPAA